MKLDMIVCRVESGSFELSGLKFLTRANPSYGQVGLDFFTIFELGRILGKKLTRTRLVT
jgi:hypothetical protein